jgi:hypothetical protein
MEEQKLSSPPDFAKSQTALMYTVYQWFETNEKNLNPEVGLFFDAGLDIILGTMEESGCDMRRTFQIEDILARWNLNRHYPLLQPNEKRDLVPSTHLEFVDFLKSLQYHIKLPCDYYENNASSSPVIEYDSSFFVIREGVYEIIKCFKRACTASDKSLLKLYPVRELPGRTGNMGIESAGDETLPVPWNKTGAHCRANKLDAGAFTEYDKLAYEYFLSKGLEYLPQCSISGSTHAVLSTFLWCTSDVSLSRGEMARMLLAIMTMLVLDGGHAIQECVSTMGIVANAYTWYGILLEKTGDADPGLFRNVKTLSSIMYPIQFFPLEYSESLELRQLVDMFDTVCVQDLFSEKKDRMKFEKKLSVFTTILGNAVGSKISFHESKRIVDHLMAAAVTP